MVTGQNSAEIQLKMLGEEGRGGGYRGGSADTLDGPAL
eukprot:COSAG01_NODE_66_length_29241_cov_17.772768_28_plen_38_part_00